MKCPITHEIIKKNDSFVYVSRSRHSHHYSSKAFAQYIDNRGDLRDPMTRETLNSKDLRGVKSKLLSKLAGFWRKHVMRGITKTLMNSAISLMYVQTDMEKHARCMWVTATQLLHLCRPKYRRIKNRILGMIKTDFARSVISGTFHWIEKKLDTGYELEIIYTGSTCIVRFKRTDNSDDDITMNFPFMSYTADTDFARLLSRGSILNNVVQVQNYDSI